MGIYSIFYFDGTGRRRAYFTAAVSEPGVAAAVKTEAEDYVAVERTDVRQGVLWFYRGALVKREALPWVVAEVEAEKRAKAWAEACQAAEAARVRTKVERDAIEWARLYDRGEVIESSGGRARW